MTTTHDRVRDAILREAEDLRRWYPDLGADLVERMARRSLAPAEATRVLELLRERHAGENWLRPLAPNWETSTVHDATASRSLKDWPVRGTGHALDAFLADQGCETFEAWFVGTFAGVARPRRHARVPSPIPTQPEIPAPLAAGGFAPRGKRWHVTRVSRTLRQPPSSFYRDRL